MRLIKCRLTLNSLAPLECTKCQKEVAVLGGGVSPPTGVGGLSHPQAPLGSKIRGHYRLGTCGFELELKVRPLPELA